MENKNAGDLLLPCTTCTRNCFRIHGKHNEEESLDGCSYFFKVMLGDFAQKLAIPPVFVRKLRNEIGSNVILQSPSGQLWDVRLCGTRTEMEFVQGWEKFVHHHKIEFGDFLVFKYICRSYFKVRIFGRSGCQKNVIVYYPGITHQHCDQPIDSKLPIALFSDEEKKCPLKALARRRPGRSEKKDQIEPVKRSYRKSYYVSCRRAVTQAERNQAVNAANSFSSDKPFCLITLKPSYVYNAIWLRFPNACRNRLQLPREKTKVILVDPDNKEWDVQYLGNLTQPGLCGGWRYFSFDNNLEEGDVCIFERVDNTENKLKLRVRIFRVVEECTPYKWIKGRQMDNSIALPSNYTNEKMKREDFIRSFGPQEGRGANLVEPMENHVVNMSQIEFGPEKGEEAKQIIKVSREELASNLLHKAFEPEQRKVAKIVNTASSEDLAANWTGKAFGPEQRKDAKLAANLPGKAFEPEQRKDAKQVNTVSSEDLAAKLSSKAFGPEQIKDAKQVNTISREDLAINMLAKASGPEQQIDAKQVNTVSNENLVAKFSGEVFGHEQRKETKQVNTVSRGDIASNMLAKALGHEQGIKPVHGKKENASTGRYKRAKCTPPISERKAGCRRSLRLAQRYNLLECPKKELLCPASSVDGQNLIGMDTMLLSKKTSLDDVNGYSEEEDLMIIWDSNDATHGMPPSSKALILSQGSIHKGPLMTKATVPVLKSQDFKFGAGIVTRSSQC